MARGILVFKLVYISTELGQKHNHSWIPRRRLVEVARGGLLELLTGVVLGPLPVNKVKTLGLDLAVDEGTGETGQELLGGLVVLGLACFGLLLVDVRNRNR